MARDPSTLRESAGTIPSQEKEAASDLTEGESRRVIVFTCDTYEERMDAIAQADEETADTAETARYSTAAREADSEDEAAGGTTE